MGLLNFIRRRVKVETTALLHDESLIKIVSEWDRKGEDLLGARIFIWTPWSVRVWVCDEPSMEKFMDAIQGVVLLTWPEVVGRLRAKNWTESVIKGGYR